MDKGSTFVSKLRQEYNSISAVVDKLITKQNSAVFDKICEKIKGLLDEIDSNANIIDLASIRDVINLLNDLRDLCKLKLIPYKEYLIAIVTQNNAVLNPTAPQEEVKQETPVIPFAVSEAKDVSLEEANQSVANDNVVDFTKQLKKEEKAA